MKNLLRKLLHIQTWQICLYNPENVIDQTVIDATRNMPVQYVITTHRDITIKFIDTNIVATRKGGDTHGGSTTSAN